MLPYGDMIGEQACGIIFHLCFLKIIFFPLDYSLSSPNQFCKGNKFYYEYNDFVNKLMIVKKCLENL